jgi:hypothetical protein
MLARQYLHRETSTVSLRRCDLQEREMVLILYAREWWLLRVRSAHSALIQQLKSSYT